MAEKKSNTVIAIAIVTTIVGAAVYFVMSSDGSGYQSKLVPKNPPAKIHHPWTSKKKSQP